MSESGAGPPHSARIEPVRPGVPVRLAERIWRLTAPNSGMMTGPGTNTYLVAAAGESLVIDPGPDDETHIATLLGAAPSPIRRILVTHTHEDHSPGAARLKARTGASVLGRASAQRHGQDASFACERELAGGERLALGPRGGLRVIHTPGHASNHLCYLLEPERLLFTGDHVIQGSTVVIDPPDGDMAAYLGSLRALLEEDIRCLAPGHGTLIPDAHGAIRALIRHRLQREAKVLAALGPGRSAPLERLLQRVYDDVPPALHPIAERSLLAHLLKLEGEGRARRTARGWLAA
jgi:glyoxylase-like metal-dependent hydrolase (beta-lactamase superfamily II)